MRPANDEKFIGEKPRCVDILLLIKYPRKVRYVLRASFTADNSQTDWK